MLARLLHGALALSLATEPAPAEGEPVAEPAAADQPTEPAADVAPTADADAPPADATAEPPATEPAPAEDPEPEPEPEPAEDPASEPEPAPSEATPPPTAAATKAPSPLSGVAPDGRSDDIVGKALLGGGIASLTLTAGLIGTTAWAWTEHNRAKRAIPNLSGDEQVNAQDRRDNMRTIGLVTTGAAALYGTTGVVLLLLRARDRKSQPRTVLAPSPGGLSLVGRF